MFTPTPKPSNEIVWVTAAGEGLTMAEISNEHLGNILRLLGKRAQELLHEGHSAMAFLDGEMARDAAQSAIDRRHESYMDKIEEFRQEARRRGMKVEAYA